MESSNRKGFDTDATMIQLWKCLANDFSTDWEGSPNQRHRSFLDNNDIAGYRKEPWPYISQAPVHVFKRQVQLENLFKRYRFTQDAYTNAELDVLTLKKFAATQIRLNMCLPPSTLSRQVIMRARTLAKSILGEYEREEHMSLCRFGKRASVGSPKSRSYLDQKLQENSLTGSAEHIRWMEEYYLPTDAILSDVLNLRPEGPGCTICDTLAITNVPKSWKSLRSIIPNTLLGSFYSYGIGALIQRRLADSGLDLKRLQSRHQILAQSASRHRHLVTADLSAASDSLTAPLLNSILPRAWYTAIKIGRIKHVRHNEDRMLMNSFMGMGVGFTFTVQTLVFYCLIKAIGDLLGITGTYSVYGDDLIYPRRLHRYVKQVFPQFGLILNEDKTFCEDFFRESCGGDFFHGIDVRPFQPEGIGQRCNPKEYLAFIYKCINGLLRRWDRAEISGALHFLYREVLRVSDCIYQVPLGYPDYSGVIVHGSNIVCNLSPEFANPENDWYIPWSPIVYSKTLCCFKFTCLALKSNKRLVAHQHSYYWDAMRAKGKESSEDLPQTYFGLNGHKLKTALQRGKTLVDVLPPSAVSWIKAIPKSLVRSKLSGLRLRRLVAVVATKDVGFYTTISDSTSMWTKGVR